MSEHSPIEWTDHTFNPWWGCEAVSPGCAHCYAETLAHRYEGPGLWGAGHRFRFFGDKHWAEPLKWNRKAERDGVRRRVFCASMADVFEERDELDQHRCRLFDLIERTPHLDWQVLTKRPEFAREWLAALQPDGRFVEIFPNVWLGVSIENARFTWRADVLRQIPAAVRFISAEPLLGSLYPPDGEAHAEGHLPVLGGRSSRDGASRSDGSGAGPLEKASSPGKRAPLDLTGIDWLIVGGESGPGARPMHPDWARELRDACIFHPDPDSPPWGDRHPESPAFFFKQWGEWAPSPADGVRPLDICMSHDGDLYEAQRDYVCAPNESDGEWLRRVGKKNAGRLLDARTWDEMPTVRA